MKNQQKVLKQLDIKQKYYHRAYKKLDYINIMVFILIALVYSIYFLLENPRMLSSYMSIFIAIIVILFVSAVFWVAYVVLSVISGSIHLHTADWQGMNLDIFFKKARKVEATVLPKYINKYNVLKSKQKKIHDKVINQLIDEKLHDYKKKIQHERNFVKAYATFHLHWYNFI